MSNARAIRRPNFFLLFTTCRYSYTYSFPLYEAIRNKSADSVYVYNEIITHYINKMHPTDKPLTMSKDSFFLLNIVMYLKKGSPLIHPINAHLRQMKTSGLIQHLLNRYRADNYRRLPQRKLPQQLTTDHLVGIFYICGALYLGAFAVFIGECGVSAAQNKFSVHFNRWLHKCLY